jgi:hypothetical protein
MAKAVLEVGFKATSDKHAVGRMIDSILKRGSKLMDDLHVLNVSLLMRAIEHKDVDSATRLVSGMGDGYRRASINKWLQFHGPFKWVKSDDKTHTMGGKFKLDDARYEECLKDKAGIYKRATAEPFWKFDPAPEFKGIDILALIKGILDRAEKAEEQADTPEKKAKLKTKGLVQLRKVYKELAD